MKRIAILLAGSLAACANPGPDAVDEARSPIVGGAPDTGDPAIVMLVSHPSDLSTFDTCTASLIAPKVLITAAHCLDPAKHPGYVFGAFTGPDASAFATAAEIEPHLVPIEEVHVHPDYDSKPPFHADIGVALLANPLGVTPLPVNRAPLDAKLAGTAARIVGYGQIKYGEFHAEKRDATTVVASLGADDTVVVGDLMHRSCVGDSGGPALVTLGGVETIVGVDSYAETTGCLEPAHYRRPDRYTEFLDTYVPPPPVMDAGTGGSPPGSDAGTGGEAPGTEATDESGGCAIVNGVNGRDTHASWLLAALLIAAVGRRKTR